MDALYDDPFIHFSWRAIARMLTNEITLILVVVGIAYSAIVYLACFPLLRLLNRDGVLGFICAALAGGLFGIIGSEILFLAFDRKPAGFGAALLGLLPGLMCGATSWLLRAPKGDVSKSGLLTMTGESNNN
jgi:hypothetical protein